MEKQKKLAIGIMLLMLLGTVLLSGCTNAVDKSRFIGTWTTTGGGSMTFTNDDKVAMVTGGDITFSGTYTWAVAGEKITFTEVGGTIGLTYDYRFPTSTQLIFTNSNGNSITVNKA